MNGSFELFESITVRGRKTEKMRRVRRSAAERKSLALSLHLLQGRISHTLNADRVDVLFPSQHVVDRETLKAQVQRIEPGGSTALYAGVEAGGKQLPKNRVENRKDQSGDLVVGRPCECRTEFNFCLEGFGPVIVAPRRFGDHDRRGGRLQ